MISLQSTLDPDSKLTKSLENFRYKKVFIMELLPLHNDYARIEDKKAQIDLQEAIIKVYSERSEPIVMVPVLSPKERTNYILQNL